MPLTSRIDQGRKCKPPPPPPASPPPITPLFFRARARRCQRHPDPLNGENPMCPHAKTHWPLAQWKRTKRLRSDARLRRVSAVAHNNAVTEDGNNWRLERRSDAANSAKITSSVCEKIVWPRRSLPRTAGAKWQRVLQAKRATRPKVVPDETKQSWLLTGTWRNQPQSPVSLPAKTIHGTSSNLTLIIEEANNKTGMEVF